MLRRLFRGKAEQELRLFIADLDHVRVSESPQHLSLRLVQIVPQGLSEIRVKADKLPTPGGVLDGFIRRVPRRFVRHGQGAEVQHL